MVIDSETESIEEKSDIRSSNKYSKIQNYEKTPEPKERNEASSSNIQGPVTRRKEQTFYPTNIKGNNEALINDINTLFKFDEYYKDRKNIENEIYLYHPPRVSPHYQVSLDNIHCTNKDEYINLINFDKNKITKENLNYYLKFVNYYKETSSNSISGNVLLKGAHLYDANALSLLKNSNYDINVAMKKILFPVLDLLNEETETEDNSAHNSMIYVNSALFDLIGSNIQEKEQWLEYVKEKIEGKIDYSEIMQIIDIAGKMKIDIPDFLTAKIEASQNFSKLIRRHLTEKNSFEYLNKLLLESQEFNIRTEEMINLEDIIKKAKCWMAKMNDLENNNNQPINFKVLQSLFNDTKNLPVLFKNYDYIKNLYTQAQKWQEKYQKIPKHSKTRQQYNNTSKPKKTSTNQMNKNLNERCNLNQLQNLIKEANNINYTSTEVVSLKTNYDKLREVEARILMTLEDNYVIKTKELLTEFVNVLDGLKFTTNLYDIVVAKLEYIEWEAKKSYYMSNKVLKMKQLSNLYKEAIQKHLIILPEIQQFKNEFTQTQQWLDKMSDIFYKEEDKEESSQSDSEIVTIKNKINSLKGKIDIKDIYKYYIDGKSFELKPEEVEHLLIKCEEVFDFIKECKAVSNSQSYDYKKLSSFREQILKYNIKCDEFDAIDKELDAAKKWIENWDDFIKNIIRLIKTIHLNFKN